jgi:hypothetical protein
VSSLWPGGLLFSGGFSHLKKKSDSCGSDFFIVLARDSKTDTVETEDMIHKNAIAT